MGGVGLAAHAELYSYLHPGYLADAKRLRTAVFGKLKAKGGFSGSTLAGVLPLLVHYVNEDFPLNTERKMRDVLTDIVIDGAFSGGVQYFQMLMQNPKLPPRARDMYGETRKNECSLLVSTTITAREFEDFMSVAGKAKTFGDLCVSRRLCIFAQALLCRCLLSSLLEMNKFNLIYLMFFIIGIM